jgi:hypothetical protein
LLDRGEVIWGRSKDIQGHYTAAPLGLSHDFAKAAFVHRIHQAIAANMQNLGIQHLIDLAIFHKGRGCRAQFVKYGTLSIRARGHKTGGEGL